MEAIKSGLTVYFVVTEPEPKKISNERIVEQVKINYAECPLAYLADGQLYFYSVDQKSKVQFVEETAPIFNFTFDTEGKTLYYNVERDGTLWLKSAVISDSKITPQFVVDWKLKKEGSISETYGGKSTLLLQRRSNYSSQF